MKNRDFQSGVLRQGHPEPEVKCEYGVRVAWRDTASRNEPNNAPIPPGSPRLGMPAEAEFSNAAIPASDLVH
jgi:hypothetical protein